MTCNSIWSSLVNIECYVRIKILEGMYETALHDEMNLHCRVTSYIENSNYFENIIFSFFYYEAEGITLRTTWNSRMSLRKKLWLIANRVSYRKSWQVKVNTLVRLKSDQVEQMTHTHYLITPLCLSRVAALCWRVQMKYKLLFVCKLSVHLVH